GRSADPAAPTGHEGTLTGEVDHRSSSNAECGMWNAELQWRAARVETLPLPFRIPHSAFRIPNSAFLEVQLPLYQLADHVFDGQVKFLNVGGVLGRNDEGVVHELPRRPSALAEQRHDRGTLGLGCLRRPHDVRALAARGVEDQQVARSD